MNRGSKVDTTDRLGHDGRFGETEWFGLRIGIGIYGGRLTLVLFKLRWKYFVLSLLRSHVLLGWSSEGIEAGVAVGVPIRFDRQGMRELRIGLAVSGGNFRFHSAQVSRGDDALVDTFGPTLTPEIVYVRHNDRNIVDFVLALEVHVFGYSDVSVRQSWENSDGSLNW